MKPSMTAAIAKPQAPLRRILLGVVFVAAVSSPSACALSTSSPSTTGSGQDAGTGEAAADPADSLCCADRDGGSCQCSAPPLPPNISCWGTDGVCLCDDTAVGPPSVDWAPAAECTPWSGAHCCLNIDEAFCSCATDNTATCNGTIVPSKPVSYCNPTNTAAAAPLCMGSQVRVDSCGQ